MIHSTAIIIGAGHSGLALSRLLSRRGVDHQIFDRGRVGQNWRAHRWNSLRLLTPNWANGLPGTPYDGPDPDGYMPVSELIMRMDAYAATIHAPVQCQTAVERVRRIGDTYRVETNRGFYSSDTLVLATGAAARPCIPHVANDVPAQIFQTTPAAYKTPDDLPPGGVLVVGASASGVQLARELRLSGRDVTLAVGGHVRMPRQYRGRDIEHWLHVTGLLDEPAEVIGDPTRVRRIPSPQLIGGADAVDLNALQVLGVDVVGRLSAIRDGQALFSGGLAHQVASADLKMHRLLDHIDNWADRAGIETRLPPSNRPSPTYLKSAPPLSLDLNNGRVQSILWATGYRPDFSFLDMAVFDRRGGLKHHGGVADAPGLYVLGLPLQRSRSSHQILGAGPDCEHIARHLVQFINARRAA